ncbi:hypothetical protein ACLQ2E_35430 [Streptomyces lavendulocolor]
MTTPFEGAAQTDAASPLLTKAQELLADRMSVIPPLAEVLAERKRLQEQIDATEKAYGSAYADAQAAGWTPEELRQLGAEEPTRRPQGRPRKRPAQQRSTPTTPKPRTPESAEPVAPGAPSS